MRWLFLTRREKARRQAADWIARLNGPHDEADRAEFERWYGSSRDHAAAYDRLSNLFDTAGRASRPAAALDGRRAGAGSPPARPLRLGLAIATVCAALLVFFFLSARTSSPLMSGAQQFAAFSADRDERRISLADGSEVLLSGDSAVDVALSGNERRLHLVRGEARFSVAHETRPFIVDANGTEVVAHGTQFVVRVAGGGTTVALIEGSVEVTYAAAGTGGRRVTRMRPGERLIVGPVSDDGPSDVPAPRAAVREPQGGAGPAMLQFDETPLGDAVEQVNRESSSPVHLGDPSLAGLRVSGAFRRGDASSFARSVAAAFNLDLETGSDGRLWLRPRAQARSSELKINGG